MKEVYYILGIVSFPMCASATDFICPEKIATSQTLESKNAGWNEFVRPTWSGKAENWSNIMQISLYDGHPNEIAQLAPDNENNVWTFERPSKLSRQIYMACKYTDTRIQLVKALPLDTKICKTINKGVLHCDMFNP